MQCASSKISYSEKTLVGCRRTHHTELCRSMPGIQDLKQKYQKRSPWRTNELHVLTYGIRSSLASRCPLTVQRPKLVRCAPIYLFVCESRGPGVSHGRRGMEARDPTNDLTLCELYVGYVPLRGSRQSVGQVCWEVVESGIVLFGFGACFTNCEM